MARADKAAKVEALTAIFNEAQCVVLNDFTGLDVAKISKLRRLCRDNGLEYLVVKNTLAKRSVKGTTAEELEAHFEGPTALAIGRETENLPAKILAEFAQENEAPQFKAAIVSGQVIDATALLTLAKIPSREVLLSQVLAGLKAPGNGLVSVLQGVLRNLLYAMNAIMEKKQSEGESGGKAAPTGE